VTCAQRDSKFSIGVMVDSPGIDAAQWPSLRVVVTHPGPPLPAPQAIPPGRNGCDASLVLLSCHGRADPARSTCLRISSLFWLFCLLAPGHSLRDRASGTSTQRMSRLTGGGVSWASRCSTIFRCSDRYAGLRPALCRDLQSPPRARRNLICRITSQPRPQQPTSPPTIRLSWTRSAGEEALQAELSTECLVELGDERC
jgi:hypothetical protein